jgi:hypothetical protein
MFLEACLKHCWDNLGSGDTASLLPFIAANAVKQTANPTGITVLATQPACCFFTANAEFRRLGHRQLLQQASAGQNGPSLRDQGLVSFGDVTCPPDLVFLHDFFLHLLQQALESERHAECARPLLPNEVPLRTHACTRFRTVTFQK